MDEAEAVLTRYLKAQEHRGLEALVSCWHPDVELYTRCGPDRSWRGRDTYRRVWEEQWASAHGSLTR